MNRITRTALFLVGGVLALATTLATYAQLDSANTNQVTTTNYPPGVLPVPAIELPQSLRPSPAIVNRTVSSVVSNRVSSVPLRFYGTPARSPEIRPVPGGALADFHRYQVRFALDAADPRPVVITAPGGRELNCRARFLVLANVATSETYLLAEITNSLGFIYSPTEVLYSNAFDRVHAHLRYSCDPDTGALTQDIILLEQVPAPEDWAPQDLRLEVWTEWFDSDPLSTEPQQLALRQTGGGAALAPASDATFDFGSLKITGEGRTFSVHAPDDSIPVAKRWAQPVDARGKVTGTYLIESTDFLTLQHRLSLLPKPSRPRTGSLQKSKSSDLLRRLAAMPAKATAASKTMLVAQAPPLPDNAIVLDFTIISSIPVPSGIVSWWPAGGNANCAMNSGNNGTLIGNAGYAPGKVGQAFAFDGNGDFVEIPNATSLNPTSGLTLDAWVYPTGNFTSHRDIISKDGETSSRQFLITITPEQQFRVHVGLNGTFYHFTDTYTVPGNIWTHVAMTYDGTTLALYVNGVLHDSRTYSGTMATTTQPVRIGGGAPAYCSQYYFAGRIDEPDIFDRALGASEIAAIYQAGAAGKHNPQCLTPPANLVGWWPGDDSNVDFARTNLAIPLNGVVFDAARVGQGHRFDGIGSHLEIPDAPDLNPSFLTVAAWVYLTGSPAQHRDIISKDGEWSDRQYLLTITDQARFRPHVWLEKGLVHFDGNTPVQANTWYHVAMTYDGTTLKLYVNGILDGSVTPAIGGPILTTTQPVRIGGGEPSGWAPFFFEGLIDEPMIFGRALTSTELSGLYAAGGAGVCKVDSDNDGLTDLQEGFLGTDPGDNDSDNDGLTDGWEWWNFGTFARDGSEDYDGDGVTDLHEFLDETDPNDIRFRVGLENEYVQTGPVSLQLFCDGGNPSKVAVLVDDPDFTHANWTTLTSMQIDASLNANAGWHEIWVGLRGLPENAAQTWVSRRVKLDTQPPQLTITNPVSATVPQAITQLQGYSLEPLRSVTFDLANAAGLLQNQPVWILEQHYDTNQRSLPPTFLVRPAYILPVG